MRLDVNLVDKVNKLVPMLIAEGVRSVEVAIVALTRERADNLKQVLWPEFSRHPNLVLATYSPSNLDHRHLSGHTRALVLSEIALERETYFLFARSTVQACALLHTAGITDYPRDLIVGMHGTQVIQSLPNQSVAKRFMLFGGEECYYASGGASDFQGWFDDVDSADKFARAEYIREKKSWEDEADYQEEVAKGYAKRCLDWWHIFDTHENKIVYQCGIAHNQDRMTDNCEGINVDLVDLSLPRGLK